ncbi:hypothetical protein LS71_002730 [Helicobacter jaachi]|uniref:DUF5675 domain-containing protein n=1 Tax=Helicobacter jaachi TaxID=1677920 RepID=A0A4U8TCW1_9HELI|nr:DUF5675 family protein [Helicobacter jaachi]TLD97673.1 hypothetical protein LS71_002730 [Helicobacter jaachi]
MYQLIIKRTHISSQKDSAGELTTIGTYELKDAQGNVIFSGYSAENGTKSSDEALKDYRIMPRTYKLKWCFTKVAVPKSERFRNVPFEAWSDKVESKYHERYTKWGFKNAGLLLYTPELPSFENRTIYVHIGNSGKDTQACLLLGKGVSEMGITNSTEAVREFYEFVLKVGVENVEICINELAE